MIQSTPAPLAALSPGFLSSVPAAFRRQSDGVRPLTMSSRGPVVLCILDGFGESDSQEANAIALANAPNLRQLRAKYPTTTIGTSGPDVGLPEGQMGNSEVGHLNFGAGRIAMMDISRIDCAVAEGSFCDNPVIADLVAIARERKCRMHLLGLVSDGGVHSSIEHLLALIEDVYRHNVPVVVHAFLDGRDTPPKSAMGFIARLEAELYGRGVIGTVSGRYYAMDRDKHWDRVYEAYAAIVNGTDVRRSDSGVHAVEEAYRMGTTDEFVEPVRIGDYSGVKGDLQSSFGEGNSAWTWVGHEVALAFNFRPDRMRELSAMLTGRNLPADVAADLQIRGRDVIAFEPEHYVCMTEYDAALNLPVAFRKEKVAESFGEILSSLGLKQFRCAETEKYAHVTYFFNGGREEPFLGEDRKLIPSPRDVATYDEKPEMSATLVASEVVKAIESGQYDFILVNFANPDMVGHTGNLEAAIQAVEHVDREIGRITKAALAAQGTVLVTADHGNCEQMKDAEGHPHTAHTTNRVPLILVSAEEGYALREGGRICDVAPTMLDLMGIEQPAIMTGGSLLERVAVNR